jgi:septal ring factor EnvC (AmiA/AmiB activator)
VNAAFLLAIMAATGAPPMPLDDPAIEVLRQEEARLRRELRRFDTEEAGILGTLERLSLERLLLEQELRRLTVERRQTTAAIAAAGARAELLAARIEARKTSLAFALREAYKLGRLREVRILLTIRDPAELGSAARYLSEWSRADAERVEAFRADAKALATEREQLAARQQDLLRLGREASEREATLARNHEEQETALRRLEGERAAGLESLKEIEEASGRLQALLESLPPGERVTVDGGLIALRTLRGHLPWPVPGAVLVPFGDQRHPRFRTVTPHPGIDLEAPEGSEVRPVFGGQVVFSDWFRGYGNTVIVDHGDGLLSIYAHLRELSQTVGAKVDPATVLGRSGSTGSLLGPRLYLEIREHGRPIDPLQWLHPRSPVP